MEIKTMKNNQIVVIDKLYNKKTFFSYETEIAIIRNDNNLLLTKKWDYSKTTLKYLYQFMKTYLKCDYYSDFLISNNKRAFIQNLISKNIIRVKKED